MLRAGDRIGPYTLVSRLGRGAFGVVWLSERRAAIATTAAALKIPLDDDVDLESIKREANLWVRASGHPNVLPIIEADIYDGQVVIASEYAPDGSLESWLRRCGKAPAVGEAVEIVSGVLAGLEHLHARSIIHRDLKPANILFQGITPRLADFGISRVLRSTSQSGNVAGTPVYMAPEAFDGKRNEQTDIWSVGVIFYQMLSGRLPFPQTDITSLVGAIITRDPDPLPHTVPAPLREVIDRSLAKDVSRRFRSATEMRAALRNPLVVAAGQGTRPQPVPTLTAPPVSAAPPKPPPPQPSRRVKGAYIVYALVCLVGVLVVVVSIFSLSESRGDTASTEVDTPPLNFARTQASPGASGTAQPSAPVSGIVDELNGSSIGVPYGITYADVIDGQGAVFSRENESRIQYGNVPGEGTLEWWINVKSGYQYDDYRLMRGKPSALIFTTVGPDVWYPGGTGVNVSADGTLSLDMVMTKYLGPRQTLTARNTNFRFNQWHSVGVSFGSKGQHIMLDGVLVASAPHNTQRLGRGGTHESAVDIPTVGELVSGHWENNRYDAGFEGIVDRFRISNKQQDWYLSAQSPR